MKLRLINEAALQGKRVFCRVDFNVPIQDGKVLDNTRILKSLETIKYLIEQKAKVILCSHLGRPKGRRNMKFSLIPVFEELKKHLNVPVFFSETTVGEEAVHSVNQLRESEILLLENVRFYQEEEQNQEGLSKSLSQLAEIFVFDAFGTAHRAHSSTVGVAQFIPAYAGFLMQKEVQTLSNLFHNPPKPFVAIIGGSKISSKIGIVKNLLQKVDSILIGGGMAYTFLKSHHIEIGNSLFEKDYVQHSFEILQQAKKNGVKFCLPIDHLIANEISNQANSKNVRFSIPSDWFGVDIGSETIEWFKREIERAKTIFWNGPMGIFEIENFSQGTFEIAKTVAKSSAQSVVGGGDSIAAINRLDIEDQITHISTGGGASLEFLEGKKLPGVQVLLKEEK